MTLNLNTPAYFQDEPLPENTGLVGWSALVHALKVMNRPGFIGGIFV